MMKHPKFLLLFIALAFVFVIAGIAQEKAEETVTCPACGKEMKKSEAKISYEFKEKTYYFCCEHCKEKFIENPEEFLKKKEEIMHQEHMHGEEAHKHKEGEEHAQMHKEGEEAHTCPMMCLLDSNDVNVKVEKTENGITVTISSENAEIVKKIQEMATKIKSMHEHKEGYVKNESKKKEIKK